MNRWVCECGWSIRHESGMTPQPCEGCDKCGTTYGIGSLVPQKRMPHQWEPRYNPRTGAQDSKTCSRCLETVRL